VLDGQHPVLAQVGRRAPATGGLLDGHQPAHGHVGLLAHALEHHQRAGERALEPPHGVVELLGAGGARAGGKAEGLGEELLEAWAANPASVPWAAGGCAAELARRVWCWR
jgi:hypothetical protein